MAREVKSGVHHQVACMVDQFPVKLQSDLSHSFCGTTMGPLNLSTTFATSAFRKAETTEDFSNCSAITNLLPPLLPSSKVLALLCFYWAIYLLSCSTLQKGSRYHICMWLQFGTWQVIVVRLWLVQKSSNKASLGFRLGESGSIPPNHTCPGLTVAAYGAVESLVGAPWSTWLVDTRKTWGPGLQGTFTALFWSVHLFVYTCSALQQEADFQSAFFSAFNCSLARHQTHVITILDKSSVSNCYLQHVKKITVFKISFQFGI